MRERTIAKSAGTVQMPKREVAGGQPAIEEPNCQSQGLPVAVPICLQAVEESIIAVAVRERESEADQPAADLREQRLEAKNRNSAEFHCSSGGMLIPL